MRSKRPAKRGNPKLHVEPELHARIGRAAALRGMSRSDFVVEAARNAAGVALPGQTLVSAGPEAHAEFVARLERAPAPNERLRKALRTPPPWDGE